ncbi:MAG: hypothetical protein EOP45_13695 [Sphingobacteriaceae bacterium]|nr:MAG: hypothetical protein EOP45_13695 [Sphingobacteriaceae bacterium]
MYSFRKFTCKAFQRAITQYATLLESRFREFDVNDDDSTGSSTYEEEPSILEIVAQIIYDEKTVFSTNWLNDDNSWSNL